MIYTYRNLRVSFFFVDKIVSWKNDIDMIALVFARDAEEQVHWSLVRDVVGSVLKPFSMVR